MRFLFAILAVLTLSEPAKAECNCNYQPDYINVRNGDLIGDGPVRGFRAYRWTDWHNYRAQVRRICSARGNTCTAETRRWLSATPDANGN